MIPRVGTLPDGARGVDVNQTITGAAAAAFVEAGFTFAVRYVRRHQAHPYDLSTGEVLTLLAAGLGVMIVQHVAPPGWFPTPDDGTVYGSTAARESHAVGIPSGVTLWLDLEGVDRTVPHADTAQFCRNWYDEVAASGYMPGLYVGDSCGLSPQELYQLPFTGYWSAYSNNVDDGPVVRGFQMYQHAATLEDLIVGFSNQTMDVDIIKTDKLGGTPSLLLP